MASHWHRRSVTVTRRFPSFSPAATAMWCKRRIRASRSCASRSSYRLWKGSFVKLWNVTENAIVAIAWCSSRAARHEGRDIQTLEHDLKKLQTDKIMRPNKYFERNRASM